jgi:putative transposase
MHQAEGIQIFQVHPNLISLWKKEFLSNAGKVFGTVKDESEQNKKLKKENDELVHQIGQLTVDIAWLKKKVL